LIKYSLNISDLETQTGKGFVNALPVGVYSNGTKVMRDIMFNETGWQHGLMKRMYTHSVNTVIDLEAANNINMELQ
jgi:hypothetical protein